VKARLLKVKKWAALWKCTVSLNLSNVHSAFSPSPAFFVFFLSIGMVEAALISVRPLESFERIGGSLFYFRGEGTKSGGRKSEGNITW
jgi:hypothetical protein